MVGPRCLESFARTIGSDDADWVADAPEVFPDITQGWYLLSDSGGERNIILAFIKQDFSFDRVVQEL